LRALFLLLATTGCATSPCDPAEAPEDHLLATGLYADICTGELAEGIVEYEPNHLLWSDGVEKRRFLQLPPEVEVNTADPDFWVFAEGTRVWKEFSVDGVPLETRMIGREANGWTLTTYAWNKTGDSATEKRDGASNVLGTDHDIPSAEGGDSGSGDCGTCHDPNPSVLLGVSAIQLAGTPVLADLEAAGQLTDPLPSLELPGDADQQEALGYLHANCGNCHNRYADWPSYKTWLETDSLGSVAETTAVATGAGIAGEADPVDGLDATLLIDPGSPESSLVYQRLSTRSDGKMPFLGTEAVDPHGIQLVSDLITGL
jgi:hypothetical protein